MLQYQKKIRLEEYHPNKLRKTYWKIIKKIQMICKQVSELMPVKYKIIYY